MNRLSFVRIVPCMPLQDLMEANGTNRRGSKRAKCVAFGAELSLALLRQRLGALWRWTEVGLCGIDVIRWLRKQNIQIVIAFSQGFL